MAKLKEWMAAATVPEQEQLAKAVKSHRMSLYQFAAEGKTYSRKIRAEFAEELEKASEVMHNMTRDREGGPLPIMRREELADVCDRCPYARRCGDPGARN